MSDPDSTAIPHVSHEDTPTVEERDARLCEQEREDGSLCGAWKVRGERLCAAHMGLGLAASPEAARAAARVTNDRRREQAQLRAKRAVDVYRDVLEAHAQEFADARLAIIRDKHSTPSERLQAMSQLEDRALGKPTAVTEDVTVREPEDIEAFRMLTLEEQLAVLERRRRETGRA